MNALIFEDVGGNRLQYAINNPDTMDKWSFEGFLNLMKICPTEAAKQGFLSTVDEKLKHERFRLLVNKPEATMNTPLAFIQDGNRIKDGGQFALRRPSQLIEIRREPTILQNKRNPNISLKDRHLAMFELYGEELIDAIDQTINDEFSPNQVGISISALKMLPHDSKGKYEALRRKYLLRAATAIHNAPFENWSKFREAIPFRNGYEMWINYANGGGGVCSEKAASLKFICDIIGLECRPVIATQSRLSTKDAECLEEYYLSYGNEHPPFDIKHLLLEVDINDETYLIDVTGGNVPLLFLNKNDAEVYFKVGYSVRMVSRTDKLFLHRVPTWVGDAHLLVCEYHLPDAHFDLTFNQDLGLEISRDQYVAAFFDYGGEHSNRLRRHYENLGKSQKLAPPIFINKQTNSIPLTNQCLDFFQDTRSRILQSYPDKNYTGDVTIVIQSLGDNFWRKPMISRELLPSLK